MQKRSCLKSGSTDTLGFKEKRKGCSLQLNPAAPHQPPPMTRHSQPLKLLHVIECPTLHHADLVFHQLPAKRRGQFSRGVVPSASITSFDPRHLTPIIPSTQPRLFPLSRWKSTVLSPTQYPPALLAEAHRRSLSNSRRSQKPSTISTKMGAAGPSSGTHRTRSCFSPAKSFLLIRVMLLPLSSL